MRHFILAFWNKSCSVLTDDKTLFLQFCYSLILPSKANPKIDNRRVSLIDEVLDDVFEDLTHPTIFLFENNL